MLSSRSSSSRPRSSLVFFLLCLLCRCHLLRADSPDKLSVAVIGAGIGGATASYFLREALGDEVEIAVFDSASKAGGRTDVSSYESAMLYQMHTAIVSAVVVLCAVERGCIWL